MWPLDKLWQWINKSKAPVIPKGITIERGQELVKFIGKVAYGKKIFLVSFEIFYVGEKRGRRSLRISKNGLALCIHKDGAGEIASVENPKNYIPPEKLMKYEDLWRFFWREMKMNSLLYYCKYPSEIPPQHKEKPRT